jgi:hypothetical protein
VHPFLNITAIESWVASGSVGRHCGSIYASTLIQTLMDCSSPLIQAGRDGNTDSIDLPIIRRRLILGRYETTDKELDGQLTLGTWMTGRPAK